MTEEFGPEQVKALAPSGHYIALRIGFAFPMQEVNGLPQAWVDHYTAQRFMLDDPVIRWMYTNTGATRWSQIDLSDSRQIFRQAWAFGLRYGVVVCCFDGNTEGLRSFGSFARGDREFEADEIAKLSAYVTRLHHEMAPPSTLTQAELEALRMVKSGLRLKQIAHNLGVTEGAVKQRLKNAKLKLGAKTGTQAATMASKFGLI
jgi:LuxR family transcriptional regulator, quorum-sensing system regulator SdiA